MVAAASLVAALETVPTVEVNWNLAIGVLRGGVCGVVEVSWVGFKREEITDRDVTLVLSDQILANESR